jgi:hypothetical protein
MTSRLLDARKTSGEHREVTLHDVPHRDRIDLEVAVSQGVAHSDDAAHRHVGMVPPPFIRQPAGGFADDLEMVHYPRLHKLADFEALPAGCGVALDALDGLEDVAHPFGIALMPGPLLTAHGRVAAASTPPR